MKRFKRIRKKICGQKLNIGFGERLIIILISFAIVCDLMFPQMAVAEETAPPACEAIPYQTYCNEAAILSYPSLPLANEASFKTFYILATAYSSTPDQTDSTPFITAKGTRVRNGIVAANFLKFGTKLRFPDYFGNREFVVEDRMNRRFQNRIDIWMPTRAEARKFGVRILKVEVYQ